MIYNAKEFTLDANGAEMRCVSFGKGERPLVIIPGLSLRSIKGMAVPLAYMYRIFAKDFKVFVFDRRNDVPAGFSVKDIAEDIACAMDTIGIENADVFGVSQGGAAAQYLAVYHPRLVRTLTLGVTYSRLNDTVSEVVNGWIKMLGDGGYAALINDMTCKMYSDKYVKKYERLLPVLSKFTKLDDPNRFAALAKACLTCDIYDELEKIKCPVFVIGGKQDKIVTGKASEEIAEKLGADKSDRCRIFLYDDLGHAAYEEAKDFNQRVLDFILDPDQIKYYALSCTILH